MATSQTRQQSDQGSIVLMTALMMTILLGFLALAVDASFMYDTRNQLHAAADAGAKSAAFEVRSGNAANMDAFVAQILNAQVAAGSLPSSAATAANRTVRLCSAGAATCTGPYAGNANFVEVILRAPTGMFFGRALGVLNMTPTARAVAGFDSVVNENCIIALGGPGAPSNTISLSGQGRINAPTCGVSGNGNYSASGQAWITTSSLGISGSIGLSGQAQINAPAVAATSCTASGQASCPSLQGAPAPIADPLGSLPEPANPGGCQSNPSISGQGSHTIGPLNGGTICYSGLSKSGQANVTLRPGTYYINGNVSLSGQGWIDGTAGVTIYIAGNGSFSHSGQVVVNLTAPTTGPYAGITLFQRRGNSNSPTFSGQGNFTGALYFPNADVDPSGQAFVGGTDCRIIIARSFSPSGQANLANGCEAYGGSPLGGIGGANGPVTMAE